MKIIDSISLACKKLLINEPFYGLFVIGLNKVVQNQIPTAGVRKAGINVELAVNEKFWEGLTKEYRMGIMKHEILHIAFNHIITHQNYSNKELFNIAADLEINQYIQEDWLPDFCLRLEQFGLQGQERKGTKYYYEALKKDLGTGKNPNLDALYGAMKEGKKVICSHEGWKDFKGLSETEKRMIESQVKHQAKNVANACKSQGDIPSELRGFVDALFKLKPPVVNWKKLFRRFVGGSNEIYTKKTRRKQSKRINTNPGLRIKTKPRGIIYWDQSGSVSDEEHKMFFNEVKHMYKGGLNFDIAPFNTKVFQPYKYKGENKYQQAGGGTSFTPIAKHFNKICKDYSFGIILTDGYAEIPPKFKKPMLWVVTPGGLKVEDMNDYPGVKIKMNNGVNN